MLRELLASFSVDTSQAVAALKQIDGALEGAKGMLGALADAFVGFASAHAISEFVSQSIEAGSRVNDLSERLGIGVEQLQQFQFAAGLAGIGAADAAKGLEFLNKGIGDALAGNTAAVETFAGLGIALKDTNGDVRSASDLVPDLADAFAKMGSDAERTALAMKVFGKSGVSLIPLLKGGSAGAKEMLAEFERLGGGMSKEFVAAADEAGDEIDKLKFTFNGWRSQLAFAILPTVTHVARKLQGWVGHLRQLTRDTNLAKLSWVAMGTGAGLALLKTAAGMSKVLGLVPKGASFFETVLGLGKTGLIIGGIVALALVLEDLWVAINGGDSAIKDWLSDALGVEEANAFFSTLKGIVDEVSKAFKDLGPELKPILTDLMKMAVEAGPGIAKAFVFVTKAVAGAVRLVAGFGEAVAKTIGAVTKLVNGDNSGIDSLGKDLGGIVDRAGDAVFGKGGLFDLSQSSNVADYGVPASMIAAPAQPMIGPPLPPNQQNQITVNVQGGKDPYATGKAVERGVKDALSQADLNAAHAAVLAGG